MDGSWMWQLRRADLIETSVTGRIGIYVKEAIIEKSTVVLLPP
jgi:hypothetical protein